MILNIQQVLMFFDGAPPESSGHATAICSVLGEDLGIGLLKHCLEMSKGAQVRVLDDRCTQLTKRGSRLDAWVEVAGSVEYTGLYQVEVKNWSAHAIGGERFPDPPTPEKVVEYRLRRWIKEFWDESRSTIRQQSLAKVLEPMKRPKSVPAAMEQRPLACVWSSMHPLGLPEPLFEVQTVPLKAKGYTRLWVFSMSTYLRSLTCETVELEMGDTARRIEWLRRMGVITDTSVSTISFP